MIPELDPDFYGLTDADLDTEFHITNTYFGANKMPLRTLLTALRETYCSSIGAEFMYISDPVQKRWWQENSSAVVLDRCTRLNVAVRFSKA